MQAKHISDETAADDNGISASAQVANNAALTIGGALHSGGTVTLTGGRIVVITSGSDDSAIDFTVVGTDVNGDALSETIDGADGAASTTAHGHSVRRYSWSSKLPQWHHRRCARNNTVQTQNTRH
jgi:predicted outer membrane repeat protein